MQKENYQAVSKPSLANKAEANEENQRQSVLDKKLNKVKKQNQQYSNEKYKQNESLDSARQESSRFNELQTKLQKAKKEIQDLRYEVQKKTNEGEQKDKKITELEGLVKELKQYSSQDTRPGSMHSGNDIALKQAQDEIQRLRAMNKDREGILTEIDTKNQSLRETET